MFTIYSIGDSAFLAQILNSLAMITGTGDFEQLVAIGLVLGLFIMGVQCVMSGTRQFNLHQVFLGFLCYLCMFGPSVTVHIEDAYTGQVRTVDNVPVGAGVAGTLISNIGYGVTQLFEQGYGDVDRMTEHSFGDALKSLNAVRAIAYDASILNAASQSLGAGSDLRKSLDNYIRECTMVKIVVGQGTPEEVYGGGLNALAFQNTIYGTEVYLPGNNAAKLDCSAAWQQLKPRFEQAMQDPRTVAAVNRLAGSMDAQGQVQTTYDRITDALHALNVTQISARDYVNVAVLEPIYRRSAQGFYNDMGDSASAVMINQAIEQRNTQWAAEQSMFLSTVRPLMAFFEGFIYAITPLMAFMIVMGAFGMAMITKYFQVVVWVQLWMPVLSIVNLFILMGARNQFASIVTDPMSFYTLNNGSQILQNWIATGGMLAAATPMIALFLVTGSTYAFTSLTNRMGGGDHVNEKIASPDMVKPAEILSMMPQATSSAVGGVAATGSVIPTLDIGQGLQNNVTAAETNKKAASDALAKSIVNQASESKMHNVLAGLSQITGDQTLASAAKNYVTGDGEDAGRNTGYTQNDATRESVQSNVASNVGVNGGVRKGMDGGDLTKPNPEFAKYQEAKAQEQALAQAAAASGGQVNPNVASNLPAPVDPNTFEGEYSIVPPETKTEPYGRKSTGFSAGVDASLQVGTNRGADISSGGTATSGHRREVRTNFTENDTASRTKQLSNVIQGLNSEQLGKLQGLLKQEGLSSNVSSVISAEKTYQEAKSAVRSVGLHTTGKLNEVAGEIAKDREASGELRSQFAMMSRDDKEAVNRIADKFHNVNNVEKDRAHDMAILQHMANQGEQGLGQVASIYAHAKGYESPMIQGPGRNNIEKPQTIDRNAEQAKLSKPAGMDEGKFDDRFNAVHDANAKGAERVAAAHEADKADLQNVIDGNDKKAYQRNLDHAIEQLRNDEGSEPGQGASNMIQRTLEWAKTFAGSQNDLIQYAKGKADLTYGQAKYFAAATGNIANSLSNFPPLDWMSTKAQDEARQELLSETAGMLGLDLNKPVQKKFAEEITDHLVRHLNDAVDTGLEDGGKGTLATVRAFNEAVRGQMTSHQIAGKSVGSVAPLQTPDKGSFEGLQSNRPQEQTVPERADNSAPSTNHAQPDGGEDLHRAPQTPGSSMPSNVGAVRSFNGSKEGEAQGRGEPAGGSGAPVKDAGGQESMRVQDAPDARTNERPSSTEDRGLASSLNRPQSVGGRDDAREPQALGSGVANANVVGADSRAGFGNGERKEQNESVFDNGMTAKNHGAQVSNQSQSIANNRVQEQSASVQDRGAVSSLNNPSVSAKDDVREPQAFASGAVGVNTFGAGSRTDSDNGDRNGRNASFTDSSMTAKNRGAQEPNQSQSAADNRTQERPASGEDRGAASSPNRPQSVGGKDDAREPQTFAYGSSGTNAFGYGSRVDSGNGDRKERNESFADIGETARNHGAQAKNGAESSTDNRAKEQPSSGNDRNAATSLNNPPVSAKDDVREPQAFGPGMANANVAGTDSRTDSGNGDRKERNESFTSIGTPVKNREVQESKRPQEAVDSRAKEPSPSVRNRNPASSLNAPRVGGRDDVRDPQTSALGVGNVNVLNDDSRAGYGAQNESFADLGNGMKNRGEHESKPSQFEVADRLNEQRSAEKNGLPDSSSNEPQAAGDERDTPEDRMSGLNAGDANAGTVGTSYGLEPVRTNGRSGLSSGTKTPEKNGGRREKKPAQNGFASALRKSQNAGREDGIPAPQVAGQVMAATMIGGESGDGELSGLGSTFGNDRSSSDLGNISGDKAVQAAGTVTNAVLDGAASVGNFDPKGLETGAESGFSAMPVGSPLAVNGVRLDGFAGTDSVQSQGKEESLLDDREIPTQGNPAGSVGSVRTDVGVAGRTGVGTADSVVGDGMVSVGREPFGMTEGKSSSQGFLNDGGMAVGADVGGFTVKTVNVADSGQLGEMYPEPSFTPPIADAPDSQQGAVGSFFSGRGKSESDADLPMPFSNDAKQAVEGRNEETVDGMIGSVAVERSDAVNPFSDAGKGNGGFGFNR